MKRVGLGLLFLLISHLRAQSQFLGGIFSQGATEIANNEAQIVAPGLLAATANAGYSIVENGLTVIGQIHGAEFGLHQAYFASLSAVNPAVAGMPEVQDCLAIEQDLVTGLSAALGRWRRSGALTADELAMADGVYQRLCQRGSEELAELRDLLTEGRLVIGDAERMERVRAVDQEVKREWLFGRRFAAEAEVLIGGRVAEKAGLR